MVDGGGGNGARPAGERSTAELMQQAGEQVSRLVRAELALARADLAQRGRQAGMGAGLVGGGGLLALYGIGALVLAGIAGLATVLPDWLAALLVGVALLLVAGGLALAARRRFRQAAPPPSPAVVGSLRQDLTAVSAAVAERPRP